MTEEQRPRLESSIARLVDGEPEPEDIERLAQAIYDDAALAGELSRLLQIDDLLRIMSETDREAFVDAVRMRAAGPVTNDGFREKIEQSLRRPRRDWRHALPGWRPLAATIACGAALVVGVFLFRRPQVRPPEEPAAPPHSVAAPEPVHDQIAGLLVDEVNARFADQEGAQGGRFRPGQYSLEEGAVRIRFASGADVVLQAPSRFIVEDASTISLLEGRLRAVMTAYAKHFVVRAPGIIYEDLGTEFGLAVDGADATSEIHVFDGTVDLKSPEGNSISLARSGESYRFAGGQLEPAAPPPPATFLAAADIGFLRWKQWQETVRRDPELVCYYPLLQDETDREVRDRKTYGEPVHGRILNARWVSGRWANKPALLFDGDQDAVQLTLPAEYRQLTLAAWLKLDRADQIYSALFNSDGWQAGTLQWQIMRFGTYSVACFPLEHVHRVGGPTPIGRWVHLAAVINLEDQSTRVYVNGKRTSNPPAAFVDIPWSREHPDGAARQQGSFQGVLPSIAPGEFCIGNWRPHSEETRARNRALKGRIDEFAMWQRCLTDEEIQQHARMGQPAMVEPDWPAGALPLVK